MRLYIGEDGTVVGHDLTEPFAALLDSRMAEAPAAQEDKPDAQTGADRENVLATTFDEVRDGLGTVIETTTRPERSFSLGVV